MKSTSPLEAQKKAFSRLMKSLANSMKNHLRAHCFAFAVPALLIACQEAAPISADEPMQDFNADVVWADVLSDFDLFYAYRDSRGFDADAYLDKVGRLVTATADREEFRRRLHRATYAFTDPHLGFGPKDGADFNTIPSASDLQVGYEAGRYSVIDVRAGSAALAAGIRSGLEIIAVDGMPIDEQVLSVFADLVEQPSDAQRAYAATLVVNGRRDGDRRIDVQRPNGTAETLTLANARLLAEDIMDGPAVDTRRITMPNGADIAILRINNRLGDNDFIAAFDDVVAGAADADGIILDMRNTPSGGNTEVGKSIIGHFTADIRPYQVHEVPSLEREFGVPRRFVEYVYPREPYFDPAKTVVLGGYWTGSMGEGIVIGMDAIGVHSMSSDMGDLLGGMSNFSFDDNKITLGIPTETLFHVDGTPREDFIADTALISADSDASGSDPALTAALEQLDMR
jgi:hypothetical protein